MPHSPDNCPELPAPMWRAMRTPALNRRAPAGMQDFERRAFWMAANIAIEQAYAAEHPGNVVLYGSDFAGDGPHITIQLPRGVPDAGRLNALLQQLRGITNQRKPDIIDFTDRTMYEIKPAGSDVAAGLTQWLSPIAIANAVVRKQGGDPWNPDMCTWVPPHILPYPTDRTRRVCTGETDAVRARGLVLYRVYRKTSREEQEEYRRQTAVMTDFSTDFESERGRFTEALRSAGPRFEKDADLWLLCPSPLWEAMMRKQGAAVRRFPGTVDVRRYPVLSAHAAMGSSLGGPVPLLSNHLALILMVATGVCLVVVAAPLLAGVAAAGAVAAEGTVVAGAAAEAAAAAGTVAAEEAAVVSLEAYRAARTAQVAVAVAKETAKAAAVLLVVVSTRQASAKASATVGQVSAVRAVDSRDIPNYYDYGLDREIVYMNTSYRIVGRARVTN